MDLTSYGFALGFQKGFFENKSKEVAGNKIRSAITAAIFMAHSFYKDDEKALEQALKVLKSKDERELIIKSLVINEDIAIKKSSEFLFLDEENDNWEMETKIYEDYSYQRMLIDANNYLNSIDDIQDIVMYLQLRMLWK